LGYLTYIAQTLLALIIIPPYQKRSGDDNMHVTQSHYHIPRYLRGLRDHSWHYKLLIKQKQALGSGMELAFPGKWDMWSRNSQRYRTRFKYQMNQQWWANYDGLKYGDVRNPYKTRYPF
jgi:hypothetical protein